MAEYKEVDNDVKQNGEENKTPGGNSVKIKTNPIKKIGGKIKDVAINLGTKAWDNRGKICAVAGACIAIAASAFLASRMGAPAGVSESDEPEEVDEDVTETDESEDEDTEDLE